MRGYRYIVLVVALLAILSLAPLALAKKGGGHFHGAERPKGGGSDDL